MSNKPLNVPSILEPALDGDRISSSFCFVPTSLSILALMDTFFSLSSRARTDGAGDDDASCSDKFGFDVRSSVVDFKISSERTVSEIDVSVLLEADGCSNEGFDS